jgi:2-aminoadipate transaminase
MPMTLAPLSFSRKAMRTPESPISYFMQQALENPQLISLAAGLVDSESLPAAPVARAVADLLADPQTARAALQYGTTRGHAPLREKIVRHLEALDGVGPGRLGVTADDVLVTTGSQQLLYLLSELLLDEGDIVITEAPSYFVYHSVLAGTGVRVLAVPMDEEGLDVDALGDLLESIEARGELNRLKLIYVVDYFQNPTGLTLSRPRRQRLVELVASYRAKQRILLLEDAAYRELRYEGEELPSLKSFDPGNEVVIYAGTFSKPCSPGLKTGYALLPRDLMEPLVRLKGNHDFGSGNLTQYVINQLLESGDYGRHVEYLRGVYRAKRDAMVGALNEAFGDWEGVTWTRPRGGLFVWLAMPPSIPTGASSPLMKAAVREGVLYVPGEFGHICQDGRRPGHEMRLSYGDAPIEQIREAIRRLRRAAESVVRKEPRPECAAALASTPGSL